MELNYDEFLAKLNNEKAKVYAIIEELKKIQMDATERGEIDTAFSLIKLIKKYGN